MPVVDVLCDEGFEQAARLPGGKHLVRPVRPRPAEVVVEDLAEDRQGALGVGAEVVDLQHPGVVVAPQAALAAERRDAALHADARTSEGGEVTGSADDASGFADLLLWLRGSVASFHGCEIVLRAGDGSQPAAPGEASVSGLAPRRLLIGPHPVGNSLEPCDTRLPALVPRSGAGSCRFVEAYTRLVRPWQAPDEREKPLFVQHHRGGRLALRTVAQIVERGGGSKRSREACRPSHLPPLCRRTCFESTPIFATSRLIVGHKSLESTQIYTHVSLEDLKEVVWRSHPHGRRGGAHSASGVRGASPDVLSPCRMAPRGVESAHHRAQTHGRCHSRPTCSIERSGAIGAHRMWR